MKWLFAALAVLIGVVVGYLAGIGKKKHLSAVADLHAMCNIVCQKIENHFKIKDILDQYADRISSSAKAIVRTASASIGDREKLGASLPAACRKAGLREDESETVLSLFSELGNGTVSDENAKLADAKSAFARYEEAARADCAKNVKLYLELGILLGLGVGIVLL